MSSKATITVLGAPEEIRRLWDTSEYRPSYAIEAADQAALMNGRDREQFLRVVQDFAAEHRLDFHVSRKALSKGRRR